MDGTAAVPVSLEITAGQPHLVSTEPDLSWQNIAPGFTSTIAVSLHNTMSAPAELTIAADDVADHPGTGGTALGNVLQLAATGWHDTLDRVADQPSPNLIVVPANATGNVNIQLSLPGAVDNRAQGASTTFTLNFNTSTGSVGVPVSTSAGFPGGGSGGLLSGLAWTGVAVLATIITGIALLRRRRAAVHRQSSRPYPSQLIGPPPNSACGRCDTTYALVTVLVPVGGAPFCTAPDS
jgi:hypothetical protein